MSTWWHGIAVGVPLMAILLYLFLTDTLGEIRRHAADPKQELDPMVAPRLGLCSVACLLIVPLADLATAFRLPWYWLAGPAVLIGFWVGRSWEMLKRIGGQRSRKEGPDGEA